MLKARISDSNIIKLDPSVPFYMTKLIVEDGLTDIAMVINFSLDPIEALSSQAQSITVQILSAENNHPTVLDDVIDAASITENIQTISSQTKERYNEFRQNSVLGEVKFDVSDILQDHSSELASAYADKVTGTELLALIPEREVASLRSRLKGRKKLLKIAEDIPASTSFQESVVEFFAGDDIKKRFTPNLQNLEDYALEGAVFDQHIGDVGFYPFPISTDPGGIGDIQNSIACPYSEVAQSSGLDLLAARDFYPVVLPLLQDLETEGVDFITAFSAFGAFSAIEGDADASSTVASAYQELIAYNDSKRSDVVKFPVQLKRLPYAKLVEVSNIEANFPDELVLKVIVKNKNNVTLSTSTIEKNIRDMINDYFRPIVPPTVSLSYSENGSDPDLIDTPVMIVEVTQRDPNATLIAIYKKQDAFQFGLVGSIEILEGETGSVEIPSDDIAGAGSITFRCIAVNELGESTVAFTDRTPTEADISGAAEVSSEFLPPAYQQSITATYTPLFEPATSTLVVNIEHIVPSIDGANTISAYSALQCRRLTLDEGGSEDDITAGQVITDIFGNDYFPIPGDTGWLDGSSQGLEAGTYTYVIDGLYDDGTDTTPNVTNSGPIEVGPEVLTTDGSILTETYEVIFSSALAKVLNDENTGQSSLQTTFEATISSLAGGFKANVKLEETTMKFLTPALEEYELNVHEYDTGSTITSVTAATEDTGSLSLVTFKHLVPSSVILDLGLSVDDFASGGGVDNPSFTVSLNPGVSVAMIFDTGNKDEPDDADDDATDEVKPNRGGGGGSGSGSGDPMTGAPKTGPGGGGK